MVLMLCEEKLGVKSYTHVIEPETEVPPGFLPELEDDVRRLSEGEPVQYVLGFAEFYGLRFNVSPAVLVPRPETEQLVKEVVCHCLELDRKVRVLDLCTGSGCIAWTVAKEVPEAEVLGVDISDAALSVAGGQFAEGDVRFLKADVLQRGEGFDEGLFDVIVSNPPYVMDKEKALMRKNVLDYEPHLALFVPDDDPLVFYRALAGWMQRFLKAGGIGFVEINESLGLQTARVFEDSGYKNTSIIKDFFGRDRFLKISE